MDDKAEALKQKEALTALTRTEGWHILRKIVNTQIANRTSSVLNSPLGAVIATSEEQEFVKGEISGLKIVLALPEHILSALQLTSEIDGEPDDE